MQWTPICHADATEWCGAAPRCSSGGSDRTVTRLLIPSLAAFASAWCSLAHARQVEPDVVAEEPPAVEHSSPSASAAPSPGATGEPDPAAGTGTLHVVVFVEGFAGASLAGVEVDSAAGVSATTNDEGAARLERPEGEQCVRLRVSASITGGASAEREACKLLIVARETSQALVSLDQGGQHLLGIDRLAPGEVAQAREAELRMVDAPDDPAARRTAGIGGDLRGLVGRAQPPRRRDRLQQRIGVGQR